MVPLWQYIIFIQCYMNLGYKILCSICFNIPITREDISWIYWLYFIYICWVPDGTGEIFLHFRSGYWTCSAQKSRITSKTSKGSSQRRWFFLRWRLISECLHCSISFCGEFYGDAWQGLITYCAATYLYHSFMLTNCNYAWEGFGEKRKIFQQSVIKMKDLDFTSEIEIIVKKKKKYYRRNTATHFFK